jgi:peptidoglycan/xylan/chitin deacetylase (PgdA/CDA1 family)
MSVGSSARAASQRAVGAAVLAAILLTATSARAATAPTKLFHIHASSLHQDGQQLVWHVALRDSFAPRLMQRQGQSLCLLIERLRGASVAREICVNPPRGARGSPRLVYTTATGRPRVINAVITRGSTRELTATFLPSAVGIGYRSVRWQARTDVASPACALACAVLFPARPALARLHTPKVVGCIPSGPSFVSSGPSNRHVIALTFDDGPWPDTPQFLDVLERKHVRATFFEIGEQISTWGQGGAIERRMFADGDMIGDHTWNHANVSGDGPFAAGEISQTSDAMQSSFGFTPCLFRAPGGAVSGALISEARSMGLITIEWDIDTRDWSRPGTDAIYSSVVGNAHDGAIVLQHEGGGDRSQTLAALPREIDTLRARGYQFVTIPELLGIQLIYK